MAKSYKRNSWYYRLFYHPLQIGTDLYLKKRIGYRHDKAKPTDEGMLVVANHVADFDPFILAVMLDYPATFVLSDHLKRNKILGKIIDFLFDNIARVKARTESRTAFAVIKAVKEGRKVLIFPEGSETYSGKTGHVMDGLGRLLKLSGGGLLTVRFEGVYGNSPRWQKGVSKGYSYGRIMHQYSSEELKKMKADEIEAIIHDDIDYDFYEDEIRTYKSKTHAENIECALFLCPECMGISTLSSSGNFVKCSCGLELEINDNLRVLKDKKPYRFDTIKKLFDFQDSKLSELKEKILASPDEAITSDDDVYFGSFTVTPPENKKIGTGRLSLYSDRLEFKAEDGTVSTIYLKDITDITTVQKYKLYLRAGGDSYFEFGGSGAFSPVKYALLASELSEMRSMVY